MFQQSVKMTLLFCQVFSCRYPEVIKFNKGIFVSLVLQGLLLLHSLRHAYCYMASIILQQRLLGITFNNMHGVSFSRKQSGITPFVYKALIFRTATHQQISCPFKYCTSVRHIDPYEISTWCTHLNEQCFQRGKKK